MNKVIKTAAAAVATLAVATSAIVSPLTASAYYDDQKGNMPSLWLKDCDAAGDHCTLTDMATKTRSFKNDFTPVFNNIYNNSAYGGDEKNFVGAIATKNATGQGTVWTNDVLEVEDGEIYSIRMYIHNDNPNGEKAASTGTSVAFNIPQGSAAEQTIDGFIYSDNAASKMVSDFVTLKSKDGRAFHLEYQYGESLIRNQGYAQVKEGSAVKPVKLGDEVVTNAANKGIKIGYKTEGDGIIPGCFGYTTNVVVKVKVVYDDFTVDKKVRLAGTHDEFTESIDAKIGDKVEYQIQFHNISGKDLANVIIRDVLPNNMVYIGNTTYLYNSNHKDGKQITPDGDLFTTGINIGAYKNNASGWVRFTAEVVDKDLACGDNVLVNWAQGKVSGDDTIHQDHSKVKLTKVCETPVVPELPKAGPVVTLGGAVAAGTIVTAAGYFIMSRRAMR